MELKNIQPKKSILKRWWFWTLAAIVVIIVGASLFTYYVLPISIFPTVDGDNPPKFIQADFVELDKVFSISKYRSGVGHDYGDSGETCRSMKHYFSSMNASAPKYKLTLAQKEWPKPVEGKDVTIFSPVDGRVLMITHQKERGWVGDEIKIVTDARPKITLRLMHVTPINSDIKMGKKVKAGEKVGLVLANQSFDLAMGQTTFFKSQNISYFAAMQDSVFAKYQARGVKSRDDLIVTKEYRDAHPFQCIAGSEEFVVNYADGPEGEAENMVHLSGYDEIYSIVRPLWEESKQKK